MNNPLQSLRNTVIMGLILLVVMVLAVNSMHGQGFALDHAWSTFFMRWLHVVSGIMWIGILWYFNFVQIPNMGNIPDDQKPAIIGLKGGGAKATAIGIGMWFGMIMWFNVWFIIWPNQKKALGIVEADADTKAASARTAMLFSRTNTLLSFPMLYAMVSAQNIF
jgi:uncharacterized membrane protein